MNEGEFKKRIIEKQWIVQDTTDILKDIDEAKKEFPIFEMDEKWLEVNSLEAIKWFIKWFGDKNE
jgi:hypothetical protein